MPENQQTPFSAWLKKYLRDRGLSNNQFAQMVGINETLVGLYLRDVRSPTYLTLQKIRSKIKVDMNELIG